MDAFLKIIKFTTLQVLGFSHDLQFTQVSVWLFFPLYLKSLFFYRSLCWHDLSCFSSCRYQPPLPADQVKPLNEYEEEGGEFIVFSLIFQE